MNSSTTILIDDLDGCSECGSKTEQPLYRVDAACECGCIIYEQDFPPDWRKTVREAAQRLQGWAATYNHAGDFGLADKLRDLLGEEGGNT